MHKTTMHLGDRQFRELRLQSDRTGLPVSEHVRRAIDRYLVDVRQDAEDLQQLDMKNAA